jgi:hypothetical protein
LLEFRAEVEEHMPMKVVVEIPFARYYRLLGSFEQSSQEAKILRNGMLDRDPEHAASVGRVMITCDVLEAQRLCDCALRLYPEAVTDFQKAIDINREL